MVTGFIRLNGQTVGVVANRSKVYGADAETEAEFDAGLTVDNQPCCGNVYVITWFRYIYS